MRATLCLAGFVSIQLYGIRMCVASATRACCVVREEEEGTNAVLLLR